MLAVKQRTGELELGKDLRNPIRFNAHPCWFHLSVAGSRKGEILSPLIAILVISTFMSGFFYQSYEKELFLAGTKIFMHRTNFTPTFTAVVHHLTSLSFKVFLIHKC